MFSNPKILAAGFLGAALIVGPGHAQAQVREPYTVTAADGVPLNVIEAGSRNAPAMIFIHGVGQSTQSWAPQFNSDLSTKYHLVAFDLRGHAASGKPWQQSAYNKACTWADDVAAVIDAAKLSRPIMVVWSYGGTVGMDYVRCRGIDGLAGLVFVAARSGLYPNARLDPRIPQASEKMKSSDLKIAMEGSLEFTSFLTHKPLPADVASAAVATNLMYPAYARRANDGPKSLPDGSVYRNNEDMIGKLKLPLLFVLGEKDAFSPADEAAKQIRVRFPSADVVTYPETGHWVSFEAAALFNSDLHRFASRVFGKAP